jgi:hypothetical protein
MRAILCCSLAVLLLGSHAAPQAQVTSSSAQVDSDSDGLADGLEQRLLEQFAPRFEVARADCSTLPADFSPGVDVPTIEAEDGTLYGQAFPLPRTRATGQHDAAARVELHFYHLWRRDCGEHGHPLDAEHVSVLLEASEADGRATWKALYWYAAAHEQTVCDVSQIARAATLHAEDKGATVWISPGKHASYLDRRLCTGGCGADRCEAMMPLKRGALINLGEPGHAMNGSLFAASSRWPLLLKMEHSDFPSAPIARLERLPATEIAWFSAGRHPVQGIIAISSSTESALGRAASDTAGSAGTAGESTSDAISVAGGSAGGALGKSYRSTRHALGTSARHVGRALGGSKGPPETLEDKAHGEPR